MNYELTIGLEVHAELNTATKIYYGCKNAFDAEVNSNCCPICTGMPGTLPTLNEKVVEYAVKWDMRFTVKSTRSASRTGRTILSRSAEGYQISQFDIPLCEMDTWMLWLTNKAIPNALA